MEQRKLCISVAEMAESLGLSFTMAYRIAKDKKFYPAKKVCGRIIVSQVELEQWVKEQSTEKMKEV